MTKHKISIVKIAKNKYIKLYKWKKVTKEARIV